MAVSQAISMLTQCAPALAAGILGTVIFTKPDLCNKTLGKVTKSKCDITKRLLLGFLAGFTLLVIISGRGGYGAGYGGGMGMY